jgi:hypothetical protein
MWGGKAGDQFQDPRMGDIGMSTYNRMNTRGVDWSNPNVMNRFNNRVQRRYDQGVGTNNYTGPDLATRQSRQADRRAARLSDRPQVDPAVPVDPPTLSAYQPNAQHRSTGASPLGGKLR